MILTDGTTYYDILEVSPNAQMKDIRDAYLLTKATYTRDSAALYTILSTEERETALKKIEEAYDVLSNPEKRRAYDQSYGFLRPQENNPFDPHSVASPRSPSEPFEGIAADRFAPMENLADAEEALIPPSTDFTLTPVGKPTAFPVAPPPISHPTAKPPLPTTAHRSQPYSIFKESQAPMPTLNAVLQEAVDMEKEWSGHFIRRIREAYRISLEEMAAITRVTKSYLIAIEEENYAKLPAPVYIRGFITQISKVLKLPQERVATSYLARYLRHQKRA